MRLYYKQGILSYNLLWNLINSGSETTLNNKNTWII